jgi:hypothetical protein
VSGVLLFVRVSKIAIIARSAKALSNAVQHQFVRLRAVRLLHRSTHYFSINY